MKFDTTALESLTGYSFPVFTSVGGTDRARRLAARTERVVDWLTSNISLHPTPPLFVLGADDWDKVALVKQYGLAHVDRHRIVMGQKPALYWDGVLERVWGDVAESDRRILAEVYGSPTRFDGFADLVIAHELTHLGEEPWLGQSSVGDQAIVCFRELFANVGLQGYAAEVEPDELPTLNTICEVVWRTPAGHWPIRELPRMAEALVAADDGGANYVWFEYGLITLAKRLWHAGGAAGFRHLHAALDSSSSLPTYGRLVDTVGDIDVDVADSIRKWPRI